jgi:hypothetical protein
MYFFRLHVEEHTIVSTDYKFSFRALKFESEIFKLFGASFQIIKNSYRSHLEDQEIKVQSSPTSSPSQLSYALCQCLLSTTTPIHSPL